MKLAAFRVFSFRSIVDSAWIKFSHDGITVLVGQNESGKTSVLEALYYALTEESPTDDDVRIDSGPPRVHLRIEIQQTEARSNALTLNSFQRMGLCRYLKEHNGLLEFECVWERDNDINLRTIDFRPVDIRLEEIIQEEKLNARINVVNSDESAPIKQGDSDDIAEICEHDSQEEDIPSDETDIYHEIWKDLPLGVLFNEEPRNFL